jgi:phage major head subunit gpT-like protein
VDINIFTGAMNTAFLNAMSVYGKPAPIDAFVETVPSTQRIETYPWMSPAPGISRYAGFRRLAQLGPTLYQVTNYEYDGALSVKTRDIEDDMVGAYPKRMGDLVAKADSPFRAQLCLTHLAAGKTLLCFDGTPMFAAGASGHNIGSNSGVIAGTATNTSGNLLGFTASGDSSGVVHRFVLLITNTGLKPLLYQNRKSPKFDTDAGTKQSSKAKKADYWIDLEAAPAFGYWWDAVMVEITNTPTIQNIWDAIDCARRALRGFKLPKARAEDPDEYPHEQLQFSPENSTIVCSTGIESIMDHALNEMYYGTGTSTFTSNNIYHKKFNLVASNRLNS